MNKTVLILAIFAFCLTPALSQNMRGGENNNRELASVNLGNLGDLIGNLIGAIKNATNNNNSTTNSTSPSTPTNNTNNTSPSNSTNNNTDSNPTNPTNNTDTTTPPANPNWYARNDVDMAAFKDKCLAIHNVLRAQFNVSPALTWSDSLAASAQAWAENMAVNGFRHSGRAGENIASTTYSTKVLLRLLGLWTKEQNWFIKGCTYPKCSSNGNEVGHFTQMVWEKTTQVGCGFAAGVNKGWNYLCCQYSRAGNVIGQKVFPVA